MEELHSRHKGNIAEAFATARLLELGFVVLVPVGNMERFDLVLYDGEKYIRVQVKTGRLRDGVIKFSTRSVNYKGVAKTYNNEVDLFVVYCPTTKEVYAVNAQDAGTSTLSLRVGESKTTHKTRLAIDHILRDRSMVDQGSHKARAVGSNPTPATSLQVD